MILVRQGLRAAVEAKASRVETVKGPDGINRPVHRPAQEGAPEGPLSVEAVLVRLPDPAMVIAHMTPEEARFLAERLCFEADALEASN